MTSLMKLDRRQFGEFLGLASAAGAAAMAAQPARAQEKAGWKAWVDKFYKKPIKMAVTCPGTSNPYFVPSACVRAGLSLTDRARISISSASWRWSRRRQRKHRHAMRERRTQTTRLAAHAGSRLKPLAASGGPVRKASLPPAVVQSHFGRSGGPHTIPRHSPSNDGRLSTPYGATFLSEPGKESVRRSEPAALTFRASTRRRDRHRKAG